MKVSFNRHGCKATLIRVMSAKHTYHTHIAAKLRAIGWTKDLIDLLWLMIEVMLSVRLPKQAYGMAGPMFCATVVLHGNNKAIFHADAI